MSSPTSELQKNCKHRNEAAYIHENKDIWMCNLCGKVTGEREHLNIYTLYDSDPDGGVIEECDAVRVIRITSQKLNISEKDAHAMLTQTTIDNPLVVDGESFWSE